MTANPGHYSAIVAIRVQALDCFAQSGVDRRIARVTFGRVNKYAGFVAVGGDAGRRFDCRNGERTRNPRLVEHNHQNAAAVAIGVDAIGSCKESFASRLDVFTGKFDQDASLISGRRNSLRRFGDGAQGLGYKPRFLSERHEHLLMIAVARNRIRGIEKRFAPRRSFH